MQNPSFKIGQGKIENTINGYEIANYPVGFAMSYNKLVKKKTDKYG